MKNTIFLVFLMLSALTSAQKKEVIFTIDESPVYSDEFIRIYNKNIDLVQDESQKDVDEYLQLFIDYKLKIKQAEELGLDEDKNFLREFNGYKRQLAKNYLTDTNATEKLLNEAYNRSQQEVKAQHILVIVGDAASPEDTLKAYNQIVAYRKDALKNGFDAEMKKVNNGKTVYAEDLGYFSAFRMVYPFETVAYNTSVGEISQPVRTRFGYHIIKVLDKRQNRGELDVAHIMIASNAKDPADEQQHAKEKIDRVYAELLGGADFDAMAKNFSEDKASAQNGGRMSKISSGKTTSPIFEDTAFSLKNPGDISHPIKTKFGWHIIKLIKKYPLGTFDQEKRMLEMKIKDDSRSKYITESFIKKLKAEYDFSENEEGYSLALNAFDENLKTRNWTFDKGNDKYSIDLFTINNDEKVTAKEFLEWIEIRQRRFNNVVNVKDFVAESYQYFVQQKIMDYREAHLADQNAEYANILQEYRDGLLLFDLMEHQIWDKAKEDTVGLKKFYNAHKTDYKWKKRGTVSVASCSSKEIAEKVAAKLKNGVAIDAIKESFNSEEKINVMFSEGIMEIDNDNLPENYTLTEGVSSVYEKNTNEFLVVAAKEIKEPAIKKLDEVKGRVISDYQKYLEDEWMSNLRKGHAIEVNKKVLKKVKRNVGK
ncbi:peptidyl-prolyl cis-trans isomerase SurA [Pustulibacterium marinum]|uniref:Peptidyl-prolyl cis-trans isomerase SurA n=1 Tax=Pustulibacterium marinum TaxID=1224947 RepID=A0A1I7FQU4_9FLAO|nr:peptidylprolyl isomerase [Pustulibacterium marinum]SFU38577.1 peptidyl-prolyl cis-trans isomerase SurA [Pustulibacterium marinum]